MGGCPLRVAPRCPGWGFSVSFLVSPAPSAPLKSLFTLHRERHATAQFSGSSPRPQDSPLSGPVQRPEIGRKKGLKIALITEGPNLSTDYVQILFQEPGVWL